MIIFFLGCCVGTIFGVLIAGLCAVAHDAGEIEHEVAFQAGKAAGHIDHAAHRTMQCPYVDSNPLRHWWTRGYSYEARLLRAIEAEQRLRSVVTDAQ